MQRRQRSGLASHLTPDLCVIGAGPSGLAVAEAARRLGASVAIVEKAQPGGSSLHSGALALSALAAAAKHAALAASAAPFGVTADPPAIAFRKLHDHIAQVLRDGAARSGAPRLAALGIELVPGTGAFTDPRTLKVGDVTIEAGKYVIATGARSVLPDLPGLLGVPYFTTETIFDNSRKPEHLLVIGAGPMGLEIGLSYRRLGAEVTIVDAARPLAHCDPELAEIALRRLGDEGVKLYPESSVVALVPKGEGIGATVRIGEQMQSFGVSHVLVAPNRVANFDELNLDAAKIRRSSSEAGALQLNAQLRTTNPRIFAVGEAAGHAAHLSALEADLVARAALTGRGTAYDPLIAPRLTLTDPPIAEIGLTEPVARARLRGTYSVLRAAYAENDLARAQRQGMGLVKLVLGRGGRIVGAGIVGEGAGELVALFALAIAQELDAGALATLAAPYPSYADLARNLGEQAVAAGPRPRLKRGFSLGRLLG